MYIYSALLVLLGFGQMNKRNGRCIFKKLHLKPSVTKLNF